MSMSDLKWVTLDYLGSVWYHSEVSDSTNQKLVRYFFLPHSIIILVLISKLISLILILCAINISGFYCYYIWWAVLYRWCFDNILCGPTFWFCIFDTWYVQRCLCLPGSWIHFSRNNSRQCMPMWQRRIR